MPSNSIDEMAARYARIEESHGAAVAKQARRAADGQFDLLVGSTVHNVRGILSSRKGALSMLLLNIEQGNVDPKMLRENMVRMNDWLSFLERFIEDVRAYSRAAPATRRRERIADLVQEARRIVTDDLRARSFDVDGVCLDIDVPENITAEVARHQVAAAITHVLRNAYEAFDEVDAAGKSITIQALVKGEAVEIAIADNGPGIDPVDLRDILDFIPGRTTKKTYGTGFGLPTAYRYAAAHGGSLTIQSQEGKGTTVTISLPLEQEGDDETTGACD